MNMAIAFALLMAVSGAGTWFLNGQIDDLKTELTQSQQETQFCKAQREHLIGTVSQQNNAVKQLKQTNTVLSIKARKASKKAQTQLKQWQDQINTGTGHEDLNQWLNGLLQ